jgi:hypothetical protein
MYERERLERRGINVLSAAAATVLSFGPAEGEIWRIVTCNGHHDDPAAHTLNWIVLGVGAITVELSNGIATNQWIKRQVYVDAPMPEQLMLGYGDVLSLNSVDAMAAGKKLYAFAVVEVLKGVVAP